MARQIRRFSASLVRPGDNTAYAAGDQIANSATAGSVVNPTFDLTGFRKAKLLKLGCDVTPASSNLVITAFDFAALLFKVADVVTATGDNVAINIAGVDRNKAAGKFVFSNAAWTNPAGALTAGTSGFQEVLPAVPTVNGHHVEFTGVDVSGSSNKLALVLQALAAWTPTGIVNTFNFWLDAEVEP